MYFEMLQFLIIPSSDRYLSKEKQNICRGSLSCPLCIDIVIHSLMRVLPIEENTLRYVIGFFSFVSNFFYLPITCLHAYD